MEYKIYQLNLDCEDRGRKMFASMDFLKRMGVVPSMADYREVYKGRLAADTAGMGTGSALEHIYVMFNGRHPEGFHGHSLSMSDVVLLGGKYYYCDRCGWVELQGFGE